MSASVRRDVVILACAISAGIHGALVPAHLDESAAAGWAFAVSTAILALLAFALTRHPDARLPLTLAAATLAGLIAAYALAVTTGLPLLHPEPEPVDSPTPEASPEGVRGIVVGVRGRVVRRRRPRLRLVQLRHVPRSTLGRRQRPGARPVKTTIASRAMPLSESASPERQGEHRE